MVVSLLLEDGSHLLLAEGGFLVIESDPAPPPEPEGVSGGWVEGWQPRENEAELLLALLLSRRRGRLSVG